MCDALGIDFDPEDTRDPKKLGDLLKSFADHPLAPVLNSLLLRSMKQATYDVANVGHFGLASKAYLHFTSPIRRYPDLVVHRCLAALIEEGPMHGERRDRLERDLPAMASQSSERERRAEEAEREVLEWKKVVFMRDKVGMTFRGIVTGVAPFGLFVELDEYFVQGLVPVATIGGDFWKFHEREHRLRGESTLRELRLGDHVKVEVESIDEDKRQIEFRLLELAGSPIARRER
jgi:ribonuclease R